MINLLLTKKNKGKYNNKKSFEKNKIFNSIVKQKQHTLNPIICKNERRQ